MSGQWTLAARVLLLAVVLTTVTAICTFLRPHFFLSRTSAGEKVLLHHYVRVKNSNSNPIQLVEKLAGQDLGRAFFVFGDSYADVGNTYPNGSGWDLPYGETWPGRPTGRFSDGHIQPDFLASHVLRSPSPTPVAHVNATNLLQGVNFAVGGAGVTYAFGTPNISTQVSWLEALVKAGRYSEKELSSSVTLVCVAGNDYSAYRGPLEDYVLFIERVVGLMEQSLLKLYQLGLRNIMVTTLAPLNCLPTSTYVSNFTSCSSNVTREDVEYRHNLYLETLLEYLNSNLPGVNIVLLRLGDALKEIQKNGTRLNITEPFIPCCFGECGAVDPSGKPRYTLCGNPENYVVWDTVHPTQAGWKNTVKLYSIDPAYTTFASTLQQWVQDLP